jgi:Cu(I)/Ag(I) efflux system membrane protein CusA/SilA
MTETIVHLKPQAEWRPGVTIESLRADMSRAVQLPGVTNIWTMPIVNRIDMLTTGVRSELGIKIYGADLVTLERSARQIGDLLRQVPGAANVYPDQTTGAQYLDIRVDREAAARYGLQVAAVQEMVRTAVGETPLFLAIEGRQRVPVVVRFAARDRADVRAIENVLVTAPSGAQVALADVATIQPRRGPSMIASENGLLVSTVLLNVEGRDVGGFVRDASQVLSERLALPAGYYFAWSGRFENEQSARQRLMIVIPVVLFVIFVLLFFVYHSWTEAAHVLLAVPFALTGGLYLLWALGYNFSVAVWVGFIALFGTAVQTGVVMVIYLEEAVRRARAADASPWTRVRLRQAVIDGALLRLRPKVMTVATVVASLLPIMWSTSPGSEVMKPLATPVLGGMISSLLHVLIVTPVIFYTLHARGLPLGTEPVVTGEGLAVDGGQRRRWAPVFAVLLLVVLSGGAVGGWLMFGSRSAPLAPLEPPLATMQRGDMAVALTAADGTVRLGRSDIIVEFRRSGGTLVDVGTLKAGATMAMPGMAMTAGLSVQRVETGRYRVSGDYAMAGAWRFTLEWDGPPPDQATVEIGVQ